MDIPPNQTIYVNNLNDKIPKEELRRSLYSLFSQFGAILDVVALKTSRMRGQAFLAFRDITAATAALRSMQGFIFYDKPMKLSYAKDKSHAVMKADGTYGKYLAKKRKAEKRKAEGEPEDAEETSAPAAKTSKTEASSESRVVPEVRDDLPVSKVLYCANMPEETTEMMIRKMFQQYSGVKEIRLVPNRPDIAFVEFESEEQAQAARDGVQGFKMSESSALVINFAKQ